jgi:hypothetical protein
MPAHTSGCASGSGSARSRAASASGQPSLSEQLRQLDLERIIEQPDWHENNQQDFHQRLAARCSLPGHVDGTPGAQAFDPETSSAMTTYSGSTSYTLSSSSLRSEYPQSLYPPSVQSTTPRSLPSLASTATCSASSIGTRSLGAFKQQYQLQENVSEVEEEESSEEEPQPGSRVLVCAYKYLDCAATFDDLGTWDTHCKAHFRRKLPNKIDCPFACNWVGSGETGEEAWDARYDHIVESHESSQDLVDTNRRPSTSLIDYFWKRGIINEGQMKELRRYGRISGSIYTQSASSDPRHQRQRGTGRDRRTNGQAGLTSRRYGN